MNIHAMIFCWPGQEKNTVAIVRGLIGQVERLTVIDATETDIPESSLCEWIKVDKDYYYGMKFKRAIELFEGDVFLQIQADAGCDDWPALVKRCRYVFQKYSQVGIWAPEVNYSRWAAEEVLLEELNIPELKLVVQTDCIVWAMRQDVVERMKRLDYSRSNLGWGVDWAAIAYCYANKMVVIRDFSIAIRHPKGTGYLQDEAALQMNDFMQQLDFAESVQYRLLQKAIGSNKLKKLQANKGVVK